MFLLELIEQNHSFFSVAIIEIICEVQKLTAYYFHYQDFMYSAAYVLFVMVRAD